ncbi:MAG TPA: type II secretion system protein [Vicinamibacterales bacterium]|nr:type II secretion system protein [Vicinamibacterales bacterium]
MAPTEPRAVATVRSERGFTLIDLLFVMGMIAVLSALAIPGLTRARGAAQSTSAVTSMRTINSAQLSFAISCGFGFYAPDLPALGIPPPASTAPYLSDDLTSGVTVMRSGYIFELLGTPAAMAPPSCNGLGAGQTAANYKVAADPVDPLIQRFYGTNANGVVYWHTASLFAPMPEFGLPPVGQPVE